MKVFVDYANLKESHRQKGLRFIADAVMQCLVSPTTMRDRRAVLRLYGGWYEGTRFTQRGQRLAAEVEADFPVAISTPAHDGQFRRIVNAELAYSLIEEPSRHMFNTFRRYGPSRNLRCVSPEGVGCSDPGCPIRTVQEFLQSDYCPKCGKIQTRDVLFRAQQKLVDTMMVCDVVSSAVRGEPHIAVVSSDTDFWPAIRIALLHGASVTQVHTRGDGTPYFYCQHVEAAYEQAFL